MLFQSCLSLKQSCFRAVQGCFPLTQRCSALVKIRHILVWNSKKTLINTTFAFFQSTFYSKPYISAFLAFYRSRATKKHEEKAGAPIRIFDWIFAGMIFFIAGTLQKNMFFVIPIPFRTYTKHFRRFLISFWSSAEQRWFRENQRWTALKQRWSALVFLTHSETALISAEIYKISETALFSADLLWDFNPGIYRKSSNVFNWILIKSTAPWILWRKEGKIPSNQILVTHIKEKISIYAITIRKTISKTITNRSLTKVKNGYIKSKAKKPPSSREVGIYEEGLECLPYCFLSNALSNTICYT